MCYTVMMKRIILAIAFISAFAGHIMPVYAIETAPRISDREIIESLATLKTGQKSIDQRFDILEKSIDQRFDAVDQRFDILEKSIDQRFDAVDQRFDTMEKSIDQKFDQLWTLMMVMIAGIFGLIGFIVWDRKTALKPIENRLDIIESYLEHDLEIKNKSGSRLNRLVEALRVLAQTDTKVAKVLQQFSLL